MKAFPDMKSRENDKTLTEFKKHFHLDKPEQK
jgi:predicted membrane protein